MRFRVASTIILEAKFKDVDGALVDPEEVTLTVNLPDGSTVTKTKAAGELTNPSVGVYQFRFATAQTGNHFYQFFGETESNDSSELAAGAFVVLGKTQYL